MMKNGSSYFLVWILLKGGIAHCESAQSLMLSPGRTVTLQLKDKEMVQGSCLPTALLEDKNSHTLVIHGKQVGQCFFQIRSEDEPRLMKVLVVSPQRLMSIEALNYALAHLNLRNIHVLHAPHATILQGSIVDADSYLILRRELAHYDDVQFDLDLDLNLIESLRAHLQNALEKAGFTRLSVQFIQREWVLVGSVLPGDNHIPASQWVTQNFWPMKWAYKDDYASPVLIELDMEFFELHKSNGEHLGVRWPDFIKFILGEPLSLKEQSIVFNNAGISGSVEWVGHFNEFHHYSKRIAQPKLTCLSGEKVTFHSGGTFAIENSTIGYAHTDWKIHGLIVEVTPRWNLEDHLIHSHFKLSYSHPDLVQDNGSVTALQKTSLETSFKTEEAKSVILSGFSSWQEDQKQNSLKWVQNLPWFRFFAGSKQAQTEEIELAIKIQMKIKKTGP